MIEHKGVEHFVNDCVQRANEHTIVSVSRETTM